MKSKPEAAVPILDVHQSPNSQMINFVFIYLQEVIYGAPPGISFHPNIAFF